jgi:hypothetical protein
MKVTIESYPIDASIMVNDVNTSSRKLYVKYYGRRFCVNIGEGKVNECCEPTWREREMLKTGGLSPRLPLPPGSASMDIHGEDSFFGLCI